MTAEAITLLDAYFGKLARYVSNGHRNFFLDDKSRRLAQRYLAMMEKFPPALVEQQGAVSADLFDALKSDRFFGLSIPEKYGGLGLDIFRYLALVEVLASRSMSVGLTVLAHLSIGVKGVVLFGNDRQKEKYLPGAASGELLFSYALTEPATGSDAGSIRTSARLAQDGSHYILDGSKTYITNANYAGAMTVFARLDSGKLGAFVVETGWQGVKIGKEMPKMGLKASSTATVRFKDVRVPLENRLGEEGDGFKIAMTILNHGRLALGAASSGMIRLSLEDMVERAASRKQFGVSIDSFELIREKLVRAKVYGEVAAAMTATAAGTLHKDEFANAAVESSHCKLFGTTRAWDVLYDALQTAGGAGYLATFPYERRMRDFRVTTIFEGTTEIHSIYPALYIVKRLAEIFQGSGSGVRQKLSLIAGLFFPGRDDRIVVQNKKLRSAARLAAGLRRKTILMSAFGLFRHGRKIRDRQFLLRRISFVSMYCFGILSMIAKIQAGETRGEPVEDDLSVLKYFAAEAREYDKRQAGWFSGMRDNLRRSVYRKLFQ